MTPCLHLLELPGVERLVINWSDLVWRGLANLGDGIGVPMKVERSSVGVVAMSSLQLRILSSTDLLDSAVFCSFFIASRSSLFLRSVLSFVDDFVSDFLCFDRLGRRK
jgi:hypothetical protein